ncbi:hypothetical protein An11g06500 [Aspergillus niger]|uniref:Uncharacterized protein n=2 Tax=Aspergillus niger TaxID=5061 RepID=A2QWU5_ASPNC|nr:hypothetical protein An11g06500 [Aspergillus niger]CAK96947.1 hypothetical protein An11g06500 [Aspergillus niger]
MVGKLKRQDFHNSDTVSIVPTIGLGCGNEVDRRGRAEDITVTQVGCVLLIGHMLCKPEPSKGLYHDKLSLGVNVVVPTRISSVIVKPIHAVMITTVDHSLLRSDSGRTRGSSFGNIRSIYSGTVCQVAAVNFRGVQMLTAYCRLARTFLLRAR